MLRMWGAGILEARKRMRNEPALECGGQDESSSAGGVIMAVEEDDNFAHLLMAVHSQGKGSRCIQKIDSHSFLLFRLSLCNSYRVFVEHPRSENSWVAAVPAHNISGHVEKIAQKS